MKIGLLVSFLSFTLSTAAIAQVTVDEPWVRATVGTQSASGAFMTLTSARDARLVEVRSPVAEVVEIHEMALENNIMRMRAVDGMPLTAGKPTVLRPGGFHVMMMGLKAPLKAGDEVPLTLTIEGADGKRERVEVRAPVRPLGSAHGAHGPMHGNGSNR